MLRARDLDSWETLSSPGRARCLVRSAAPMAKMATAGRDAGGRGDVERHAARGPHAGSRRARNRGPRRPRWPRPAPCRLSIWATSSGWCSMASLAVGQGTRLRRRPPCGPKAVQASPRASPTLGPEAGLLGRLLETPRSPCGPRRHRCRSPKHGPASAAAAPVAGPSSPGSEYTPGSVKRLTGLLGRHRLAHRLVVGGGRLARGLLGLVVQTDSPRPPAAGPIMQACWHNGRGRRRRAVEAVPRASVPPAPARRGTSPGNPSAASPLQPSWVLILDRSGAGPRAGCRR
jgi:hypothetical protein